MTTNGAAAPNVLLDQSDLRVRTAGRVLITVWHQTPKKATIEKLRDATRPYHERHKDGVVLVVGSRGGPPDDEARTAFREMVRAVESTIAGVAVLVGVKGIRGAVVRGAVSAAVLALRLPFTVKVLDSPRAVAEHANQVLTSRKLPSPGVGAIEDAFRQIEAPLQG